MLKANSNMVKTRIITMVQVNDKSQFYLTHLSLFKADKIAIICNNLHHRRNPIFQIDPHKILNNGTGFPNNPDTTAQVQNQYCRQKELKYLRAVHHRD